MASGGGFAGEQQSWTNPSNATNNLFYTWTVPAGVTAISAVVVGGGGGGSPAVSFYDGSDEYQTRPGSGGGGGGLTYNNSISVTPGETLHICVGCGGSYGFSNSSDQKDQANAGWGGHSWIKRGGTNGTVLIGASGGQGGQGAGDYDSRGGNGPGGSYTSTPTAYINAGGTFATGGTGRRGGHTGWPRNAGSGGGAAGYGGPGGAGGNSGGTGGGVLSGGPATAGSEGGGSGGMNPTVGTQTYGGYAVGTSVGFGGGGVGVDGKGDSGAQVTLGPGKGGSGGTDGAPALVGIGTTNGRLDKDGGYFGGGGGGGNYFPDNARKHGGYGGGGAVRIIYPGETYVFPNQDGLPNPGPLNYTTASPNTYSWIVPDGITSINLYAVGAGGGGGWNDYQGSGAGGAIVWTDGVAVTPGETLTLGIGTGGTGGTQDIGGNQPAGSTYYGLLGQTTFVKRQNGSVILKAYGGGGSGGRGGTGIFNEGIGGVIDGGDAYNYSGWQNNGGGTGQYQWHQSGSNVYKGQTGAGSAGGQGGTGVGITEGYTGINGDSVTTTGGAGGFPGGGGGSGPTGGRGGHGADGALVISWAAASNGGGPIGGGSTYIDGKHSINFISDNDEDWIEYTPATSNRFHLYQDDWTIEFWHRGSSFTYQQYDQRNFQRGNATFIEGLDENNNSVWKIGASQGSITDTISWYEGTGESPKYTSTGNECFNNAGENNWRHYCFMRTGNLIQYRYGGTRYYPYNTSDYTTSMNDTSTVKIRIGGGTGTYSKGIHGKLSNVRIVRGTALYANDTYDANHRNPFTEIESGTILLCANSSNITDAYWGAGQAAGTVTTSGSNNATYSNSHPFDTYNDGN